MRHWLCAVALCGIPASAAADAPVPRAASAAPPHRAARGAPRLALAGPLAATPTQETGGVTAPLPRGNPGDPLARPAAERSDEDTRERAGEGARASDLEAKGRAAPGAHGGSRDTEDK